MRRNLPAICLLALLLGVTACQLAAAVPTETQPLPVLTFPTSTPVTPLLVIFDDDGSPDGTTALLYFLAHPNAYVKAASISYGEAHPAVYIQHIGRMLDDFGITDIPLGAGQDGPLSGSNEFPEGVRQASNGFWGWPIPYPERTYPVQPAAELMVSVINGSPEPVTVFVSGPATNIAQALRLDPGIRDHIAAVFMMGGAVYVPGNVHDFYPDDPNTVAEWNIYADPQAAAELFTSGVNLYLVPLDATNQVLTNRQEIRQWTLGGEVGDFAAYIYDSLLGSWGVQEGALWDVMTAAILVDPSLCGFQALHLQVVTAPGITSGQTVVLPDGPANVQVCLEPYALRIRQKLIAVFASSP